MKKIKVAFIGLAHPHVSALFKTFNFYSENYEMIGFSEYPLPSPDPENLEKRRTMCANADIPEFADWKDLAAQKPNLAVVNCDNAHREEVCCGLLAAGIHVLDEKPMAMTFAAAAHMCRVARENNVYMLTNWPIAWFPAFRKAKELADAGTVGKVMRVTYRSPATWGPFSYKPDGQLPPDEVLAESWWYKKKYGGGSILDYACYGAILSSWIFGKTAERVSGIAKNFYTGFSDVEDYSAMILDFGNGVGLLEGSWSTFNPGPAAPSFTAPRVLLSTTVTPPVSRSIKDAAIPRWSPPRSSSAVPTSRPSCWALILPRSSEAKKSRTCSFQKS